MIDQDFGAGHGPWCRRADDDVDIDIADDGERAARHRTHSSRVILPLRSGVPTLPTSTSARSMTSRCVGGSEARHAATSDALRDSYMHGAGMVLLAAGIEHDRRRAGGDHCCASPSTRLAVGSSALTSTTPTFGPRISSGPWRNCPPSRACAGRRPSSMAPSAAASAQDRAVRGRRRPGCAGALEGGDGRRDIRGMPRL